MNMQDPDPRKRVRTPWTLTDALTRSYLEDAASTEASLLECLCASCRKRDHDLSWEGGKVISSGQAELFLWALLTSSPCWGEWR